MEKVSPFIFGAGGGSWVTLSILEKTLKEAGPLSPGLANALDQFEFATAAIGIFGLVLSLLERRARP